MKCLRRRLPVAPRAWLLPLGLIAAILLIVVAAWGESVDVLAGRLKSNPDFRVRVQAALALGASNDPAAVKPLCDGLADSNTAVRSAAAAALGRLGMKSGIACLKDRLRVETNDSVQTQLKKSISQIEGGARPGATASRAPDANSKFYVAVGPTKCRAADRSGPETDAIVQESSRNALLANAAFAVAPVTESPAQAGPIITKFKLKGYFLQPTVDEPKYEGGKLTVVVRMTMLSYPGKALQGEFSPKLTQSNTPSKDKASEDALIKMAVARAISDFIKVASAQ